MTGIIIYYYQIMGEKVAKRQFTDLVKIIDLIPDMAKRGLLAAADPSVVSITIPPIAPRLCMTLV